MASQLCAFAQNLRRSLKQKKKAEMKLWPKNDPSRSWFEAGFDFVTFCFQILELFSIQFNEKKTNGSGRRKRILFSDAFQRSRPQLQLWDPFQFISVTFLQLKFLKTKHVTREVEVISQFETVGPVYSLRPWFGSFKNRTMSTNHFRCEFDKVLDSAKRFKDQNIAKCKKALQVS